MATDRTIMSSAVVATVATVYPGFLVGAISVQAVADFDVTESTYGWDLGGFFGAAMVGSVLLGRTA